MSSNSSMPPHVLETTTPQPILAARRLTKKQREYARLKIENMAKPPELQRTERELMLAANYSPATAKNPQQNVLSKPAFKDLLELIDDGELIKQARNIALGDDKRAALAAIDMLLKLKDRYPAGKLKVQEYHDELAALET